MSEIELNAPSIFSFDPIADFRSKVLILGTIPGKESLKKGVYYAHPQNAFWKIMFALHNQTFSTDDQIRREVLLQNGIALWDVLKSCTRQSSRDSDIRLEEPNDLQTFLSYHNNIYRIFFNGTRVTGYFRKYFNDITLPNQVLPSTSPAHAIKWEKKLEAWQKLKL